VRHALVAVGALVLAVTACTERDEQGGTSIVRDTSSASPSVAATTQPPVVSAATTVVDASAGVAALAAELSAVEAGIRTPGVTNSELAVLGRRQQLAYRSVNLHPEWRAQLIALVDPVAATPLAFHLAARQAQVDHDAATAQPDETLPTEAPTTEAPTTEAAAATTVAPTTTTVPPTLPAWTIVEPLPIAELRGYYAEAEAATGVPWQYLAAIHFQETRMGRVLGVSSAGAVGPMQFLPATWAACCVGDPTVARDAIMGAAQYLVQLGAPADMQAALFGYNPNSAYVGAVTAYAENMIADERAYGGYHGWDVFYGTSAGTVRLPVGYSATAPVDLAGYLRDHPDDLLPPG
jgi:hypothetical protein